MGRLKIRDDAFPKLFSSDPKGMFTKMNLASAASSCDGTSFQTSSMQIRRTKPDSTSRSRRTKSQNVYDLPFVMRIPGPKPPIYLSLQRKVESQIVDLMKNLGPKQRSTFVHPLGHYIIIKRVSRQVDRRNASSLRDSIVPGPRCQTGRLSSRNFRSGAVRFVRLAFLS